MSTTFTYSTPGTYDGETRTWSTPTSTSITGSAMQVQGDPEKYKALGLVESEAPTLLFVPNTYGDAIGVGWTVTWANKNYTVTDVSHVAPDGVVILTRAVVTR